MVVQDVVVDFEHQDCIMEKVAAQIVISETREVEASISQPYVGTSSRDIPDAL